MDKGLYYEQLDMPLNDVCREAVKENPLSPKEWIETKVKLLESVPPGKRTEIDLPSDVDHLDFIVELGLPERDYEIGGIFNTKTRSMLVSRGVGAKDRGMSNPQVEIFRMRRNPDESTDDIYFHTHPWDKQATISHFRDPNNSCEPSDTDTNNVMTVRMFEEEAGQDTKVVSIVSSGGYITKTEATGVNTDLEEMTEVGIPDGVANEILTRLAMAPSKYLVNYAKDAESGKLMLEEVRAFYKAKRSNLEVPFTRKLRELQERIKVYCDEGYVDRTYQNRSVGVINSIEHHYPEFQDTRALKQLGLNVEQVKIVKRMIGLTITKYKKTDSGLALVGDIA